MKKQSIESCFKTAICFVAICAWMAQLLGANAFLSASRGSFGVGHLFRVSESPPSISGIRLYARLPDGYKEFGEAAILEAARQCGMVLDDESENGKGKNRLDIDWKAGKIVVTVHGEVSLEASSSSGDGSDDNEEEEEEEEGNADPPREEFSLTLLARTINQVLDDDGMGLAIAEVHSIEVTTPGVSDELVPGTPQFEAFKGFEVLVQWMHPKKKKVQTIEGRLVSRDDEVTIVNIKGRMKKMKNEAVQSVRLPKAKREKGVR